MKEKRVLLDERGRAVPALGRELPAVPAVDRDAAAGRGAKAEQDVGERRLAGARRSDNRNGLPDGHDEVDVVEGRLAVRIPVGDVLERERPLEAGEGRRAERTLGKMRRLEPGLDLVDAAGQVREVAVQSIQLVEQREQPQQDEAVGEQVTAQHVARADEEDVCAR